MRLLSLSTLALLAAGVQAGPEQRYIVTFKPEAASLMSSAQLTTVQSLGGKVRRTLQPQNAMAIQGPPSMADALRAMPNVASVQPDPVRKLMGQVSSTRSAPSAAGSNQIVPYGIPMVQADQMPQGDANAGAMTVCVIDSGTDMRNPDLKAASISGSSDPDGNTGVWNQDGAGHGTHVTGTIAALNNGKGVVGVLPGGKVKVHMVKTFDDSGGWAYASDLIGAVNACETAGAKVISMSLGGPQGSAAEQAVFDRLSSQGVLSIAAAGNGGSRETSFPAGYGSVMSVAAIDEESRLALFSQRNADVEIAAPGVDVLSTVVVQTGRDLALSVAGAPAPYPTDEMNMLEGSASATADGALADFGLGLKVDPTVAGKLCVIGRGDNTLAEKALNCQASGGLGAIIFNLTPDPVYGTLGKAKLSIPVLGVGSRTGAELLAQAGAMASMKAKAVNYAYFSGTSMATPHVSGVAALVWSYFPSCTGEQIRVSLNRSARDLGRQGRDNSYGYGLVQARAAYDRISAVGCGN